MGFEAILVRSISLPQQPLCDRVRPQMRPITLVNVSLVLFARTYHPDGASLAGGSADGRLPDDLLCWASLGRY